MMQNIDYTLDSIDYPEANINIISVCKVMEWNSWKWIWTMEYDANHRYIQRYNQRLEACRLNVKMDQPTCHP